jgi:hypothetical protein
MPTTTEGSRLELVRESSGLRHFLAGMPVHAGDWLELQFAGGVWIPGRYEWSFREGRRPLLYLSLAGGRLVSFELPEVALLRWPSGR